MPVARCLSLEASLLTAAAQEAEDAVEIPDSQEAWEVAESQAPDSPGPGLAAHAASVLPLGPALEEVSAMHPVAESRQDVAEPPSALTGRVLSQSNGEVPKGEADRVWTASSASGESERGLASQPCGSQGSLSGELEACTSSRDTARGEAAPVNPSTFSQLEDFFAGPALVQLGAPGAAVLDADAGHPSLSDTPDQDGPDAPHPEAPKDQSPPSPLKRAADAPAVDEQPKKRAARRREEAALRAPAPPASKPVVALSGFHTEEQRELASALRKLNVRQRVGVYVWLSSMLCNSGPTSGRPLFGPACLANPAVLRTPPSVLALQCLALTGNSSHHWSPRVTHVVAPRFLRTGKVLAGLAAGNWVVIRDWLAECVKAGHYIDPVSLAGKGCVKAWQCATRSCTLFMELPASSASCDSLTA